MGQMVFPQVSVERRFNYSDVLSFLYGPGGPLCLLFNYCEAFWINWMSCRLAVLMNGWWGSKMFPESVPKDPAWFPYVLFWTVHMRAFELINYSTFLTHVVLVLGSHEYSVYGVVPLKCTCMPKLLLQLLQNIYARPRGDIYDKCSNYYRSCHLPLYKLQEGKPLQRI